MSAVFERTGRLSARSLLIIDCRGFFYPDFLDEEPWSTLTPSVHDTDLIVKPNSRGTYNQVSNSFNTTHELGKAPKFWIAVRLDIEELG